MLCDVLKTEEDYILQIGKREFTNIRFIESKERSLAKSGGNGTIRAHINLVGYTL